MRWRENVRSLGCVITHDPRCVIHHPAGRTAKHQKTPIGHEFVLPVSHDIHVLIHKHDPWNVKHQWLNYNFERDHEQIEPMTLHEFEKYLFAVVCNKVRFPFGEDLYLKIMDWHR